MSLHNIYTPIVADVPPETRKKAQEAFGLHLVEHRNRMATLIRAWIETEQKFPIPMYDRLLDRIRCLDPGTRADVASVALMMADEVATALLMTFSRDDAMQEDGMLVKYAIVAQIHRDVSDEVVTEIDVNRGEPVIAVASAYKRWLSRYAPSHLRPAAARNRRE